MNDLDSDLDDKEAAKTTTPFSQTVDGNEPNRATIYAGDIRQPWQAVYGFPPTAARLAAGQGLLLCCREDEIIELMDLLNELLKSPESLGRAYEMLHEYQKQMKQKLARLIRLRDLSASENEMPELLTEVEQLITKPQEPTVVDRLASMLSPEHPLKEIAGTGKMFNRQRKFIAALEQVKDQGFQVTVRDSRRKLMRPTPQTSPNGSIDLARQFDTLSANGLLPPKYHLTLWIYLIVRSDDGFDD